MSEKKEIAEELNSALVNSSESPYIIEKLQQKLDETVQRIHEDIIESKLAELFTRQIDAYFSELGFAVDIDVDSGMIMLLSSAEYLYDKYIIHSTENPSLDYSFIAILYYKALESLINNRLYRPFVKSFSFDRNGEKREIDKNEFSRYFDSASYRSLTKNKFMKESLEMGTIAYVLSNTDSFTTEMKNYLSHALVPEDYLYAIKDYMERLKQLSKNRNNAAHGTITITFRDAKQAKGETFIISDTAADEYRGMIVELMGMLKCYSKTDS